MFVVTLNSGENWSEKLQNDRETDTEETHTDL